MSTLLRELSRVIGIGGHTISPPQLLIRVSLCYSEST